MSYFSNARSCYVTSLDEDDELPVLGTPVDGWYEWCSQNYPGTSSGSQNEGNNDPNSSQTSSSLRAKKEGDGESNRTTMPIDHIVEKLTNYMDSPINKMRSQNVVIFWNHKYYVKQRLSEQAPTFETGKRQRKMDMFQKIAYELNCANEQGREGAIANRAPIDEGVSRAIASTSKQNRSWNGGELLPSMLDSAPELTFAPGAQSTPFLARPLEHDNSLNCHNLSEETMLQNLFDDSTGSFKSNFSQLESPVRTSSSEPMQCSSSAKISPSYSPRKRDVAKYVDVTPKRQAVRLFCNSRKNITPKLSELAREPSIRPKNTTGLKKSVANNQKEWDDDSFDELLLRNPDVIKESETLHATSSSVHKSTAVMTGGCVDKHNKYRFKAQGKMACDNVKSSCGQMRNAKGQVVPDCVQQNPLPTACLTTKKRENDKLRSKPCFLPKTDPQPVSTVAVMTGGCVDKHKYRFKAQGKMACDNVKSSCGQMRNAKGQVVPDCVQQHPLPTAYLTTKKRENDKLRSKPCFLPKTDTQPMSTVAIAQAGEAGISGAQDGPGFLNCFASLNKNSLDHQHQNSDLVAACTELESKGSMDGARMKTAEVVLQTGNQTTTTHVRALQTTRMQSSTSRALNGDKGSNGKSSNVNVGHLKTANPNKGELQFVNIRPYYSEEAEGSTSKAHWRGLAYSHEDGEGTVPSSQVFTGHEPGPSADENRASCTQTLYFKQKMLSGKSVTKNYLPGNASLHHRPVYKPKGIEIVKWMKRRYVALMSPDKGETEADNRDSSQRSRCTVPRIEGERLFALSKRKKTL